MTPVQKLAQAVDSTVVAINAGNTTPQEALRKIAVEQKLPPKFIKRASEAINVALHYQHFKKNPKQKEAEFPITDAAPIVAELFGNTQEKKANEVVTTQLSGIPALKLLKSAAHRQAYQEIVNQADHRTENTISLMGLFEKSASYIDKLAHEVDLASSAVGQAQWQMNNLFSQLVNDWSKEAAVRGSFAEFEKQAYAEHGDQVLPYLDLIYKTAGLTEKRGKHDAGYRMFDKCAMASLFSDYMKVCEEFRTFTENYKIAQENYAFEKGFVRELYTVYGLKKWAEEGAQISKDSDNSTEVKARTTEEKQEKEADKKDPILAKIEAKIKQADDAVQRVLDLSDDQLREFINKAADEVDTAPRLGFIPATLLKDWETMTKSPGYEKPDWKGQEERKLILQEMLMHDPILKKEPATNVASAYAQVMRLAPDVANEREVVRSVLRQMVTGQALSPYDAAQLSDLSLMKQKAVTMDPTLRKKTLAIGVKL